MDGDGWKTHAILRWRRVARRRRQAVTQLIENDDEIPIRIQRPAWPDYPLDVAVLRGKLCGIENDIALGGI
jgi:hypothetical protein